MADEFAKGLGILVTAGLGWLMIAATYNTPTFEGRQLLAPNPDPETLNIYGQLAITLKDVLFWFAVIGTLTFWVVIPAIEQARQARSE
ncbi:hypothetical protein BRD09_07505 [Halobacteriales archaeon SW_10_68_16]|jgi:hypothetical protein|nr:MAG: hypothetical protein BRD09_07505 [Halobacteriales archaeon SW_10_68_16]